MFENVHHNKVSVRTQTVPSLFFFEALCNPTVVVYRVYTLGLQRGVVECTALTSSDSGEQTDLVCKALGPLRGSALTDFGFVPNPRVFSVDPAGETENIPVHLLFGFDTVTSRSEALGLLDVFFRAGRSAPPRTVRFFCV